MDDNVKQLAQRLEAAERVIRKLGGELQKAQGKSRGYRVFAIGACALGVVAALLAGARPAITQDAGTTVKAPFTVVNAAGKRVLFVDSDNEGPFLRLFNSSEQTAIIAWADKDGGNMALKNAAGKNITELLSRSDGAGGNLRVLDKEGKSVVSLFARSDNAGGNLTVYNNQGKSVFAAFARGDNAGGDLGVYDREGKTVAAMFARGEGGGVMQIYDAGGNVVSKQP
jgi:hypothetical protein